MAIFSNAPKWNFRWNFEHADTDMLLQHFRDAEAECGRLLSLDKPLALPPMTNV